MSRLAAVNQCGCPGCQTSQDSQEHFHNVYKVIAISVYLMDILRSGILMRYETRLLR